MTNYVPKSFKEKFEPVFANNISRAARKKIENKAERYEQTQTKKSDETKPVESHQEDKMADRKL